jgi:PAS domain S-box-containing protein
MLVDITGRKQAEAALRESEALVRAVTDNSPDAIYVKDGLSRWLMANPAALRVIKKTAEQTLGKNDLELHDDPVVATAILENDRRVMEGGQTEAFEEVVDTPEGRCTFLSVKAPRRDTRGNVVGLIGISHDITERKRQEEMLRQSEMRFRSLANSVPDLVWTCTPDGRCDDVNSRYIEYTGVPKEALLGFEWLKQVHPDDRERAVAEWSQAMERDDLYESDFRIRNKDGEYRYFKSRGVAVRDEQGAILKWFGSNTDIEDLRRYQEQLTAVNKELESFNYAVAHDLRAPLRHVRGFSDLLIQEAGQGLSDTAQHYLTVIQDGVSRMSQLIEDLLNLSRVGRQDIRKQTCDIRPLIDQLIVELQPQIEGRNIEWRIAEVPLVVCDPALFKQVLANLLSNALKFTRGCDPAIIEVGYKRAAGDLVIFVRDNGVGFDMKYLDKLFGLFQRLHRQEDFEGTGIGLAIVQRIMHRHGGKVWAEAALNHGATFYVSLHSAEPETSDDEPTEQGR